MGKLSPEMLELIKWLHEEFDANGDGMITKEELRDGLTKYATFSGLVDNETVDRLMTIADVSLDNVISFNEFARLVQI